MALKQCSECGNEVSTKAKECPSCGAPVKAGSSCSVGCLTMIGVIFLLAIFGSLFDGNDSTHTVKPDVSKKNWRQQDNSTMAYIMMEDFVKQRLKAPKSAEFPGVFDGRSDHVSYLGNQKYRIISYVDAQNSFGANIRNKFIGEIKQIDENRWKLIGLELFPR